MTAYRCNPKAWVLATLPRSKKEIRTHRKKIQKRLPGKQEDGSFVYGFGNFRVEERVLPVFPRHRYCESRGKKSILTSVNDPNTLKGCPGTAPQAFPTRRRIDSLCTAALLWEFLAPQKCKSQIKQRTRNFTQAHPTLPEAYLCLLEGWGLFCFASS